MKTKLIWGEMLIIIVVVGVLGWITYRQFGLADAKSRDVDRKSNLGELAKVIRLYYADYGFLPDENLINNMWGKEWKDGNYVYMKNLPKEHYLNKEYCYQKNKDEKSFGIFVELENKIDSDYKKDSRKCGGVKYGYGEDFLAVIVK